jgi:hypothetical protein
MEKEKYPVLLILLILLMFIAIGNAVKIKCKSSVKYHIALYNFKFCPDY